MKRLLLAGCGVLAGMLVYVLVFKVIVVPLGEDDEDDDGVQPIDPRTLPPDFEHRPAIVGNYGVTCSCTKRLDWPPGWRHTFEAARRVTATHD